MFIGLCVAITALPVSIRILMDLGKIKSEVGQKIISVAIFDDVLSPGKFNDIAKVAIRARDEERRLTDDHQDFGARFARALDTSYGCKCFPDAVLCGCDTAADTRERPDSIDVLTNRRKARREHHVNWHTQPLRKGFCRIPGDGPALDNHKVGFEGDHPLVAWPGKVPHTREALHSGWKVAIRRYPDKSLPGSGIVDVFRDAWRE